MNIINIETTTTICSVALSSNGNMIASFANDEGMKHAEKLSPYIDQLLQIAQNRQLKIDAIAVSSGPGSYTGLRIGISTAKGLAYGLDVPLISVSTLEILCHTALHTQAIPQDALLVPMIDARRMEVYTATYRTNLEIVEEVKAQIIDDNTVLSETGETVYLFGNGAEKCKTLLNQPNYHYIDHLQPLAENMYQLAEQKYQNRQFEDVAYYEPFYLKEFQTTAPKRKQTK